MTRIHRPSGNDRPGFTKRRALLPALVLAAALPLLWPQTGSARVGSTAGLPASIVTITPRVETISYPTLDRNGRQIGTTAWRVVSGTGNCCENYIGATSNGRLLDFGGTYLNFSDDQGLTWKSARPVEPLVNGEGAVVTAPNGDVIGVEWDPYSGDHLITFKYDAAANSWSYLEPVLHTPFYDREWISVVEGPFTIGAVSVPYITVMRGGFPSKDLWFYSVDGLNYAPVTSKVLGELSGTATEWLPTTHEAAADWDQPDVASGLTALAGGGAISSDIDLLDQAGWGVLDRGSLIWKSLRLPSGTMPTGLAAMDSLGRIHVISVNGSTVTYTVSSDGGKTWHTATNTIPGASAEDWDFRTNGKYRFTDLALHAHKASTNTDQDFVFKYSTKCATPSLQRIYLVGKGDVNASAGLGASIRFDFATTSILASKKVATSILDSGHTSPAMAIEVKTTLTHAPPPAPRC